MKKFVAVESATPKRRYYSFDVYQITRTWLSWVAKWDIFYGSTRWAESEVMTVLAKAKLIPRKFESWYYHDRNTDSFKIQYIVPRNQK